MDLVKYTSKGNVDITPHFSLMELISPDGEIFIDDLFWHHMEKLENLRFAIGEPLIVTSGHRSKAHNEKVGGAAKSMHLRFASDLQIGGRSPTLGFDELYEFARAEGFSGIGRYNNFLHVDCRTFIGRAPAEWDNRK
jgi:uncharacterized protein YcbK (DUF882 family)